jgi:hypothetical protein|tara:strand:+ start:99 stop:401 length:303 start_codon:yes stop_codon:yes gene_type:complete
MKFDKNTQLMISRTYIDFSDIEFGILEFDEDVATIQLTNKGIEEYKARVKARTHKFGTDEHLIDFLIDELEGELCFFKERSDEEDQEIYIQIAQNLGVKS